MQPINFIVDYYGEEIGYYFAWLVHYTGMLIFPAIFGLVLFIIQFTIYMKDGGNFWEGWDAFNSRHNVFYALFIAVWVLVYVESWKRTSAAITSRWLAKDIEKESKERPEFISVENVDEASKTIKKISTTNTAFRKYCIALPLSLFFIGLVIVTTLLIRQWYVYNYLFSIDYPFFEKYFWRYLPAFMNAAVIIVFGAIYKLIVFKLVEAENH